MYYGPDPFPAPDGDTLVVSIGSAMRTLKKTKLKEGVYTPSFVMLGDTHLVEEAARLLAERLSPHGIDILVGPEAKVIPLLQSLASKLGHERYVVLRKTIKAYMRNVLSVNAESITTHGQQTLNMNGLDAERIAGKRVAIVDDVVATGGSIKAAERLVEQAGGEVVFRVAVMKEGEWYREPLVYLGYLPVWFS